MRPFRDLWILALWLLLVPLMALANGMIFLYAPEETVMGAAQRIFYFHVPLAIMTYGAVAVMLAASIAYLGTGRLFWDNVSRAATEVAVLFCALVLISGPIWAKPAWGTWWTWEARLTTTLVLWMLLLGALMVRQYASTRDLGGRLAAIVGIVAAADVPIVHKAVDWWRGHHPTVFAAGQRESLEPRMLHTFGVSVLVFVLMTALLITLRYRVAAQEDRATAVGERLRGES